MNFFFLESYLVANVQKSLSELETALYNSIDIIMIYIITLYSRYHDKSITKKGDLERL